MMSTSAGAGILLSSPARQTLHERLIMLSSSPVFPSLDDLIARSPKKSALRSGSRAAPIPEHAARSFTSAGDFLRSAQAEMAEEVTTAIEPEPKPPRKTTKAPKTAKAPRAPRAPRAKKPARTPKAVIDLSADTPEAEATVTATKRHRKPLVEKNSKPVSKPVSDVDEAAGPLKEKPWKRYKAAQDEEAKAVDTLETDEALPTVQGSADAQDSDVASKKPRKKPVTSSKALKAASPEPLNLEPSLPRRLDWTPPRPDAINLMSDAPEGLTPDSTSKPDAARNIFKNLKESYACKESQPIILLEQSDQPPVLGKRKLIEMVTAAESTKEDEPAKPAPKIKTKAPKKKPLTITELATAAYVVQPIEPEDAAGPQIESLKAFLGIDGEGQDSVDNGPGGGKPTKKPRASKVTKRKAEPKRQLLLSPQAALRQSAGQDFVFGTSSQLALEQSPTFLRDLQAAIQASNAAGDNALSSPIRSAIAIKRKAGGRLWSVGARDEEGELLNLEVIDLVNSPDLPEDNSTLNPILNPWKDLPPEPSSVAKDPPEVVVLDADSPNEIPKSHFFLSQQLSNETEGGEKISPVKAGPSSPHKEPEADVAPPPSNQQQRQDDSSPMKPLKSRKETPRPKYDLMTDTQLAKQIRLYGFKPVKKRSAMIALLGQCWTSKQRTSLQPSATFSTTGAGASPRSKSAKQVEETTKTTSTAKPRSRPKKDATAVASMTKSVAEKATASPKRPRGRPRKDSLAVAGTVPLPSPASAPATPQRKKASMQAHAEIADSDCEELPMSSLLSPEQGFSPVGVKLGLGEEPEAEMSLTVDPTDQQAALFKHITQAVTTAPRSRDPLEPSWHEKMLMYDPIILEDITAWLNSGRLTEVGYDGEVSPADVKKWCESKSICCLWRINIHGKERKRF